MSLSSGSVTMTRYRLMGGRKLSLPKLSDLQAPFKLGPIDIGKRSALERIGWILPLGVAMENDDFSLEHWDLSHCRCGDGALLTLRSEKKMLPAELMRQLLAQELRRAQLENGGHLSRAETKRIREELKEDLLAAQLPTLSHAEVYWQDNGDIWLFSTGKKMAEAFETLFCKTFADPLDAKLVALRYPSMSLAPKANAVSAEAQAKKIARSVPTVFFVG